jgi:hypothetical protein
MGTTYVGLDHAMIHVLEDLFQMFFFKRLEKSFGEESFLHVRFLKQVLGKPWWPL